MDQIDPETAKSREAQKQKHRMVTRRKALVDEMQYLDSKDEKDEARMIITSIEERPGTLNYY